MRRRPRRCHERAAGLLLVSLGVVVALLAFDAATGARLGGPPLGLGGPQGESAAGGDFAIALTISVNGSNGADQVTPANLSLPVGVPIHVRITCFDTGTNSVNAMWGRVMGTTSGAETVAFGNASNGSSRSWIDPTEVSHTFTILPFGLDWTGTGVSPNQSWSYGGNGSMMGGGSGMGGMGGFGGMGGGFGGSSGTLGAVRMPMMMVNLPIPAAPSNTTPSIVSATFVFETSGTFQWSCVAPCDTTAMAASGFMRGTISVY